MTKIDYSVLDRPEVLQFLFHPRPEVAAAATHSAVSAGPAAEKDVLIPVAEGVDIGARFHMADYSGANILFFHGNGEIVADYDELGPVFNQMGGRLSRVRSLQRPSDGFRHDAGLSHHL